MISMHVKTIKYYGGNMVRILKGATYGLCMWLFIVAFYQFVWSLVKPLFLDDHTVFEYKMYLLFALIIIDFVVATLGIIYERRVVRQSIEKVRKTIAIRITILFVLVLLSSLAFSVALEL